MNVEQDTQINICLCFPKRLTKKNSDVMVASLRALVPYRKGVGYAGFKTEAYLSQYLYSWFEKQDVTAYTSISSRNAYTINNTIQSVAKNCMAILPVDSLYVYVFPWLPPFDDGDALMGYVTGITPYARSIILHIAPDRFDIQSLEAMVAHEYNHATQDKTTFETEDVLLDNIIREGLAEYFNEFIIGRNSTIAHALSRQEALDAFVTIQDKLETPTTDRNTPVYKDLFFGSRSYKKWTGYAIGYHIITMFFEKCPTINWSEVMNMSPRSILERSGIFLSK